MSVRHYYRTDSSTSELIDQVQLGKFTVQHCAEEGRVGNGTIEVDDPDGSFDVKGLRTWYITESDIPDPTDQIIWRGYTADRGITRGPGERVAAARVYSINVVDQNSVLSRRIQVGNDAKRPAEKDVARMQWLVNTAEAGTFDDTFSYLHTDRQLSMDAVDYRGQPNLSVIDDCAQATGKNYWADYFNGSGIGIWYGHPGEPDYVASIAISNLITDVTGSISGTGQSIFSPSEDSKLTRDPSRLFSGVYLPYDGGYVYRTNATTATTYAARDTSMPSINVKTAAKASKRAVRYLADLDTEEDRITTTLYLPSTHVNRVKAGQWINAKFTHFPGYEAFTACRVLSRTLTEFEPKVYKVDLELSGGDVLPPQGNGAARLTFPFNRRGDGIDLNPDIVFDNTGDDPGLGREYYPLLGSGLSYHNYSGHVGDVWDGITVESDGTVDIYFRASIASVVGTEVEAVWTIMLDGTPIATTTVAEFHAGPGFFGPTATVTATDVAVTAGQLIKVKIATTGTFFGGYKCPNATGFPDEYLSIVGTFDA